MKVSANSFESMWTTVGGMRMHARCSTSGDPGNAPIVLVHGLGMSHRYMMPTFERLAAHRHVYALDLPGFGMSDKPLDALGVAELADALAGWLEANALHGAVLVGNSFGCQIIVELAIRYAELSSALVLVAPTVDARARTIREQLIRLMLDAPRERLSLIPLALYEYFYIVGFSRALQTLRYALADRIEEKLPRVALPTLVVRGGKDTLVPQGWVEELAGLLPCGRLVVIPEAAHAVNYDTPDKLAIEILRFLRAPVADERALEMLTTTPS